LAPIDDPPLVACRPKLRTPRRARVRPPRSAGPAIGRRIQLPHEPSRRAPTVRRRIGGRPIATRGMLRPLRGPKRDGSARVIVVATPCSQCATNQRLVLAFAEPAWRSDRLGPWSDRVLPGSGIGERNRANARLPALVTLRRRERPISPPGDPPHGSRSRATWRCLGSGQGVPVGNETDREYRAPGDRAGPFGN
jgi:hypothetical protein